MSGNAKYELSEYEQQRLARIKRNGEYLEALGLGTAKRTLFDEMTKKTKRNVHRESISQRVTPGEERRSSRLSSSKDSSYVMLSYEDEDDTNIIRYSKDDGYKEDNEDHNMTPICKYNRTPSRKKIKLNHEEWNMSDDEKKALKAVDENFLNKFKEFLIFHNKISDQNVRSVMRQVIKLAKGEGIRYESPTYGWAETCYFQRGINITPMCDIVQLMKEGQECENKWGRDHGNGWLLSHPLKKLLLFQQFALNNPDFLTAKCKLADYYAMDDDIDLSIGGVEEIIVEEVTAVEATLSPICLKNDRVAKYFDEVLYFGSISRCAGSISQDSESGTWHINYDDGDEEDLDYKELMDALELYKLRKAKDKRAPKLKKTGKKIKFSSNYLSRTTRKRKSISC